MTATPSTPTAVAWRMAAAVGVGATFWLSASAITIVTGNWLLSSICVGVATIAIAVAWRRWWLLPRMDACGHRLRREANQMGLDRIAIGASVVAAAWTLATAITAVVVDGPASTISPPTMSWAIAAALLFVMVIGPVAEEALMRGIIYPLLRGAMGPMPAVAASTIIFMLIHGQPSLWIHAATIGVLGAIAYERTRTLTYPVVIHVAYNTASALVPATLIDGSQPVAAAVIIGCAIATLAVVAWRR